MATYLLKVGYTLDGIRGVLTQGGSARRAAAEAAVQSAGGSLQSFYFAFGGTDVFVIADLPSNVAAAAVAMTVSAGGGATVETVVLLSPQEIDQAASTSVGYSPPGG
jgi:uncharacterized protein with GYD domain